MIKSLFTFMFAAIMWVQVPQWSDDWSKCAVDVPDTACHWYITAPDSTWVKDLVGRMPHGSVLKVSVILENFTTQFSLFKRHD